jgi:DNA-binding Lrp family transcriptional regulator
VNRQVLIDQVVRQTMVLIAHLATQGGARAPLSDVAERVFRGLVSELLAQRLSHKVIADMFGIALRTYYDRVRRLTESSTLRGRSLWEAIFDHVRKVGSISRAALFARFRHDDETVVKAVLNDLVENGLLAKSGRGALSVYVAVPTPDLGAPETFDALTLVTLFHRGSLSVAELADALGVSEARIKDSVEALVREGRATVEVGQSEGDAPHYRVTSCLIPAEDPAGFEAAILDHMQAVTGALCHRLRRRSAGPKVELEAGGELGPDIDRAIGGSTYTFDIARDNPTWERVTTLLTETRAALSALRAEADAFESARVAGGPRVRRIRFTYYCGQNVLAETLAPLTDEAEARAARASMAVREMRTHEEEEA